jgi:hypothetical protein
MELTMPKEITDAAIDRQSPHRDHARLRIAERVNTGLSISRVG